MTCTALLVKFSTIRPLELCPRGTRSINFPRPPSALPTLPRQCPVETSGQPLCATLTLSTLLKSLQARQTPVGVLIIMTRDPFYLTNNSCYHFNCTKSLRTQEQHNEQIFFPLLNIQVATILFTYPNPPLSLQGRTILIIQIRNRELLHKSNNISSLLREQSQN